MTSESLRFLLCCFSSDIRSSRLPQKVLQLLNIVLVQVRHDGATRVLVLWLVEERDNRVVDRYIGNRLRKGCGGDHGRGDEHDDGLNECVHGGVVQSGVQG